REWNEKLSACERLRREYTTRADDSLLSLNSEQRSRLMRLAQDIPLVWRAGTTTQAERKQLVRYLIKDVTLNKEEKTVKITVRWQTEAFTRLEIPRPRKSCDICRTDPQVVTMVRRLSPDHADKQIAIALNQAGLSPGRGGAFTAGKVQWIR